MKSNLAAVLEEKDRRLKRKLEAAGFVIEGHVKERTHVITGRLRSSITHDVGYLNGLLSVIVGTNVEYGIYEELGSRHREGHSYLVSGLIAAIAEVRRVMEAT